MEEADTNLLPLILDGLKSGRIMEQDLLNLLALLPPEKRGLLAAECIRRFVAPAQTETSPPQNVSHKPESQ